MSLRTTIARAHAQLDTGSVAAARSAILGLLYQAPADAPLDVDALRTRLGRVTQTGPESVVMLRGIVEDVTNLLAPSLASGETERVLPATRAPATRAPVTVPRHGPVYQSPASRRRTLLRYDTPRLKSYYTSLLALGTKTATAQRELEIVTAILARRDEKIAHARALHEERTASV